MGVTIKLTTENSCLCKLTQLASCSGVGVGSDGGTLASTGGAGNSSSSGAGGVQEGRWEKQPSINLFILVHSQHITVKTTLNIKSLALKYILKYKLK